MPDMNRDAYNIIAQDWDAACQGFVGRERVYLDAVLAAVPEGAVVLDLGCGSGRPMAEYVAARGRRVLGMDQSEALLDIARARLPQAQWVLSAMEVYAPPAGIRGAILWDALFHVARADHARILHGLVRRLPSGGRLMLTVGGSDQPAFTDTMFGQTFFYDSHTPATVDRMLLDLGCRSVIAEFMDRPDGGRNRGRYAIVAEKA